MKVTALTSALVMASALLLSACGGSSSDEAAQANSYLQFYNGAAGSGNTMLSAGDTTIGTAEFGDVSSVVALSADSYSLTLKDVASSSELMSQELVLNAEKKALFILTQQDSQYDYLTLNISREATDEGKFKLQLVNLSAQHDQLDIYIAAVGNGFANATKLDTLSTLEVSAELAAQDTGEYRFFLTTPGSQTPFFTTAAVNFAYQNTYVAIVRDKEGPVAGQMSLDLVLNSSSVSAYDDVNAPAQFRLYNSLVDDVSVSLDNTAVATVAAGELSAYQQQSRGDFSLSVQNDSGSQLLNSALLSLGAGESKTVLLYNNADGAAEALTVTEQDSPQLKSHDVIVANLVPDFERLQFYFVRQHETISSAKYHVKNLAFKKQQLINLPLDYYAIALVQVADNGSTTLLDKTEQIQLTPGKHYMLMAEQDDAAPSGYKLKLVF